MGAVEWVVNEDEYECTLSEDIQKMAKDELREDKNTRDQALEQMRNWIKMNPRILNCRLGEIVVSSSNRREYTNAKVDYALRQSPKWEIKMRGHIFRTPITFRFVQLL